MNKILIIQTAFIGDVILATSLIEEVAKKFPNSSIDFLLRNGNQSILKENPLVNKVIIWNKNKNKNLNLFKIILKLRKEKYDTVINIQRFFNSGLMTVLSGAKVKIGFHNNPLSFFFTHKIEHKIPFIIDGKTQHEVQRNSLLLSPLISDANSNIYKPKIYFNKNENLKIQKIVKDLTKKYIVLAPSSVWYTKQWHKDKWIELMGMLSCDFNLFCIGGPDDKEYIDSICKDIDNTTNFAGMLSLTESALLMKNAARVFVNDSAPLHLASSVDAKTTAIFCSTIKDFGYFPLSTDSALVETQKKLECRPCGLHGKASCPKVHFDCSNTIEIEAVFRTVQ